MQIPDTSRLPGRKMPQILRRSYLGGIPRRKKVSFPAQKVSQRPPATKKAPNPAQNRIPASCKGIYLPFTQSRLSLLGQKNNLDGELLLLAILRMSNVVKQTPSQDNCFFTLPYRLILHSFRANHFLSGGCSSSYKALQRQWTTNRRPFWGTLRWKGYE